MENIHKVGCHRQASFLQYKRFHYQEAHLKGFQEPQGSLYNGDIDQTSQPEENLEVTKRMVPRMDLGKGISFEVKYCHLVNDTDA